MTSNVRIEGRFDSSALSGREFGVRSTTQSFGNTAEPFAFPKVSSSVPTGFFLYKKRVRRVLSFCLLMYVYLIEWLVSKLRKIKGIHSCYMI